MIDGALEVSRHLEDDNLAETLLAVIEAVRARKCLDDAVGAHGLAIDKEGRKRRCIEARQQAIDDDDEVQLCFTHLIQFLLPCQAVVDVAVVGINLLHRVLRAKHLVVVAHRLFHLVLVEGVVIAVLADGVRDGDLREVGQLTLDVIADCDARLRTCFHTLEQLVIALCLLDGTRREDGRIRIALATLQAEFTARLIDDKVHDAQHVLFIFVGSIDDFRLQQRRLEAKAIFVLRPLLDVVLLGQHPHVEGVMILHLEAQYSTIMKSLLDRVLVQARSVLLLCRSGQVARAILGIFAEDSRPGEAIPKRIREIMVDLVLRHRRYSAVAFINDKDEAQLVQLLILLGASRIALHDDLQLLNRRDDDIALVELQLLHEVARVIRLIDIDRVVLGISLE